MKRKYSESGQMLIKAWEHLVDTGKIKFGSSEKSKLRIEPKTAEHWGVTNVKYNKDTGHVVFYNFGWSRKGAIEEFLGPNKSGMIRSPWDWKSQYRKGWRCVKIDIKVAK